MASMDRDELHNISRSGEAAVFAPAVVSASEELASVECENARKEVLETPSKMDRVVADALREAELEWQEMLKGLADTPSAINVAVKQDGPAAAELGAPSASGAPMRQRVPASACADDTRSVDSTAASEAEVRNLALDMEAAASCLAEQQPPREAELQHFQEEVGRAIAGARGIASSSSSIEGSITSNRSGSSSSAFASTPLSAAGNPSLPGPFASVVTSTAPSAPCSCPEEGMQGKNDERSRVDAFLAKNGFSDVFTGRRRRFKKSYPLHVAVAAGDADLVRFLLRAGANVGRRDSFGYTAAQLARKRSGGIRDDLLAALGAAQ